MPQASQASPIGSVEYGSKISGEASNLIEVARAFGIVSVERLPTRLVRIGHAVGMCGGVGVGDHARLCGDSHTILLLKMRHLYGLDPSISRWSWTLVLMCMPSC